MTISQGTFSAAVGNKNISDCAKCTAGWFCPLLNMTSPADYPCNPGFYCPKGMLQGNPYEYACTLGNRCPGNNALPEPCAPSTYQDEAGQSYVSAMILLPHDCRIFSGFK